MIKQQTTGMNLLFNTSLSPGIKVIGAAAGAGTPFYLRTNLEIRPGVGMAFA